MEKILFASLIISLCTTGIYATTWKRMILHWPAMLIRKKFPAWLYKPICGCLICMSSVYSILFFILFGMFDLLYIPVVVFTVAGFNTVILSVISNIIQDEEDN